MNFLRSRCFIQEGLRVMSKIDESTGLLCLTHKIAAIRNTDGKLGFAQFYGHDLCGYYDDQLKFETIVDIIDYISEYSEDIVDKIREEAIILTSIYSNISERG